MRLLKFIILPLLLVFLVVPCRVNADPEWLPGYDYRKEITISGSTAGIQTNYQMKLTVYYGSGSDSGGAIYLDGRCQTDFDDIRFTKSDGTTELDQWLESKTNSNNAVYWIEFDSIPASPSSGTFYIYYNNTVASQKTNGSNTFIVFDDFEWGINDDPIDDSGGSVTWTITNGDVEISTDQAYGGTRCMHLVDTDTQGVCTSPVTHSINKSVRLRVHKGNYANVWFYHGDGSTRAQPGIDSNEDIRYWDDGGSQDTGSDISSDQWELFEFNDFDWTADTFDIIHDGSNVADDVNQRTSVDYDDIFRLYGSSADDVYIDDFIVRNWCSPEPTWGSWGSEEAGGSLVFHSGFEAGDFAEWGTPTGSPTVVVTQKKTGDYAMRCNTSAATAYVDNGLSDGFMDRGSFYIYIADDVDSDTRILGDATGASLYLTTTEEIDYYTAATKREDGSTQIALTTWTRVSWATDGSTFKTFINGVEDVSHSTTLDEVADGIMGAITSCTADIYFDDATFDDIASTDDIGDIRILRSQPDANGSNSDFDSEAGSATHWENVDECTASDADYNYQVAEVDAEDTYDLEERSVLETTYGGPLSGDTINAISTWCRMKRGLGPAGVHQMVEYDGASNYETAKSLTTDFAWVNIYRDVQPDTTIWNWTDFDAYEAGAGGDSSKQDTYISCVMVMVAYTPSDTCSPDISNTPSSKGFGVVAVSSTYVTGLTYFTVTNNSGGAVTITIKAVDWTGGVGWTHSDSATPGADTAGLKAGLEGGDYTIIVKKTASYNTLKAGLADSATQKWGLKLYSPTSYSDGIEKTTTVTLTATCD